MMEHAALSGSAPDSLPNMTLQEAVFAGHRRSGRPQGRARDPDPRREHGHRHGRVPEPASTPTPSPTTRTAASRSTTRAVPTVSTRSGTSSSCSSPTRPCRPPAAPGNTPATGTVTISDTTPTAGVRLSPSRRSLADADGGINLCPSGSTGSTRRPRCLGDRRRRSASATRSSRAIAEVGLRLRVVATFLDMAGNPETIISAPTSPVAAPLVPLAAPAGPASAAAPAAPLGPLTVTVTVGSTDIALTGSNQARVVSVVSSASGKVRARFVFAPKGIKFRGTKTIVRGRDASGHVVLTVCRSRRQASTAISCAPPTVASSPSGSSSRTSASFSWRR